jgi:hypothetical protein
MEDRGQVDGVCHIASAAKSEMAPILCRLWRTFPAVTIARQMFPVVVLLLSRTNTECIHELPMARIRRV